MQINGKKNLTSLPWKCIYTESVPKNYKHFIIFKSSLLKFRFPTYLDLNLFSPSQEETWSLYADESAVRTPAMANWSYANNNKKEN